MRATWFLLLIVGLIYPMGLALYENMRNLSFAIPLNAPVVLVAGVSVFGLENRARTYRFLVHHGARPGTVWLAKLLTWCFGLAIILVPLWQMHGDWPALARGGHGLTWIALSFPLVFAVGQLCGMVIPRGITAGVVALVISIALGFAQAGLVQELMMPLWGLAAMPVTLLVVSWAWSGDWLLDRPAPGRYVRLGLLLAATFGVLLSGYAGMRAWSVPDPGPIAEPSIWIATASLSPDRNAADLYREAARQGDFTLGNVVIRSREVLDLIRKAAARPDCRFAPTERLTLAQGVDMPAMRPLAGLVIIDAQDRIGQKDLAGAWDDIMVLLRMARHVSEGATMTHELNALAIEKEALDLAIDWATAPGQTPERLHSAIAAYRDSPRVIAPAEVARAEAILFERSIDLPLDELKRLLLETIVGPQALKTGNILLWQALRVDLITTPWEAHLRRRRQPTIRRGVHPGRGSRTLASVALARAWRLDPLRSGE